MATVFRDPLISTPRSPPRPGPTIASAGLCCLLAVAGAKPFLQNDWPLAKSPVYPTQNRTYLHQAQTRLIGQDTFFGTKGKAPTYDWPLPKVKPYPVDNRTWLQSYDWGNLGKDTFFGSPGYAPDYDWPLPRTAPYPIPNRTGVAGRVIAPIFPFVQSNWPLPATHQWDFRQGEVSGRALGSGAMPFGQDDWPLPVAKSQGKSWIYSQQIPSDTPFNQSTWLARASIQYRPAEIQPSQLALYQAVSAPFSQLDWALPRSITFRGADAVQNLAALLPTGLAPFAPQSWPLPSKSAFVLGEVSGRAIGVTVQAPFSQLDWPAPRYSKFQPVLDVSGLLPDPGLQPFTPQDWPTPRSARSVAADIPQSLPGLYQVSGTMIFRGPLIARLPTLPGAASFTPPNLLEGLLVSSGIAPFTPQDWPLPRKSPFILGETSGRAIGVTVIPAPFTQSDWPLPKQAGLAARTWTWSTLLPPQVQIALPFAQTDWPLTKKVYFVQGEISGRAIGVTAVATPFTQLDWPLRGKAPSSAPIWYTVRYETEQAPFVQLAWPIIVKARFIQGETSGRAIGGGVVIPPSVTPPAPELPSLGGTKARKRIRGPYSDPSIYEAYIARCIAEREKPRVNVEVALIKEALVHEVEVREQTGYAEYDALIRENQLLQRLVSIEKAKRNLAAIAARQRQIAIQIKALEEDEISSIIMLLDDM